MQEQAPVRRRNDARVIAALRRHGELDRTQLAQLSGLARSTISDAISRLSREGIIVENLARWSAAGKLGRPPAVLSLAAPVGVVGVLALSHGTLQVAVVGFDGMVQAERSIDAYAHDPASGPIGPGIAMLDDALSAVGLTRDALACTVLSVPLPFQPGSGARWAARRLPIVGRHAVGLPVPGWLTTDPAPHLSEILGVPVWAENDANLGALGEATFGAGQGMSSLIYIKIVRGIGSGILFNHELVRGAGGLAGELGHIHLRDDGPVCACGGRGCLVTLFPTPLLVDLIQPAHAATLSLDDVLNLAADGDTGVLRVLTDLGRTLGRTLADFCVYFNPEGIILDSMLGPANAAVSAGIHEALNRFAPPMVVADVRVLPGVLGDSAELLGAAALARTKQTD